MRTAQRRILALVFLASIPAGLLLLVYHRRPAPDRVYSPQAPIKAGSLYEKIPQIDFNHAVFGEIIDFLGRPRAFLWGDQEYDLGHAPNFCIASYGHNLDLFMAHGHLMEVRYYSREHVFPNSIRLGMTTEETFEILGRPREVVTGGENLFADGVFYKDIEDEEGRCYYSCYRRRVRLFFLDNKVICVYVLSDNYLRADPANSFNRREQRYQFINDRILPGRWETVAFIADREEFNPVRKRPGQVFFLSGIEFKAGGDTDRPWRDWTKGRVIDDDYEISSGYELRRAKGAWYMLLEWKSSDYCFRGKPYYYVLRKTG